MDILKLYTSFCGVRFRAGSDRPLRTARRNAIYKTYGFLTETRVFVCFRSIWSEMQTILPSRNATVTLISFLLAGALSLSVFAQDSSQGSAPKKTRAVGVVTAMNDTSITLKTDAGAEVTVTVQPTTKLVRMEPGQTDLKAAPAIQLSDVQVGDRLLVAGIPSDDAKAIAATTAVL